MEFKFDIKDLAEGGIAKIDHTLTPLGCEEDEKYDLKIKIMHVLQLLYYINYQQYNCFIFTAYKGKLQ